MARGTVVTILVGCQSWWRTPTTRDTECVLPSSTLGLRYGLNSLNAHISSSVRVSVLESRLVPMGPRCAPPLGVPFQGRALANAAPARPSAYIRHTQSVLLQAHGAIRGSVHLRVGPCDDSAEQSPVAASARSWNDPG
jgi:hypothetical protein